MTTLTEAAGFALAVAMVVCSIRQWHWSWPLGISSSVLYFFVFQSSHLYGEASLQILFAALSLWGWWQWLRAAQQQAPLKRLDRRGWSLCALTCAVLWPAVSWYLQQFTDSDVPHWDSLVTVLSALGQYLLGRKFLENWWVWMVANTLSMGLFAYKALWLTVLLYGMFVAMSWIGWRTWQAQGQAA